jgi:hypothetical protein
MGLLPDSDSQRLTREWGLPLAEAFKPPGPSPRPHRLSVIKASVHFRSRFWAWNPALGHGSQLEICYFWALSYCSPGRIPDIVSHDRKG